MSRHDDPRASYLAVATRQFAAHGYHGASLAALAREAGVTKQALLHFFGTKDRLYAAVLTDLAQRLDADIDAVALPDPVEHLQAYFDALFKAATAKLDDAALVIRALLDSDGAARQWPMKPYLDRLINLVRSTPAGQKMTDAAALGWVFQRIGAIQYLAISQTAISAMYGADARNEARGFVSASVNAAVQRLAG